jgi:hypothetical protein
VSKGQPQFTTPPTLDEGDPEAERFFAEGESVSTEADSLAPTTAEEQEEDWGRPAPRPVTPELLRRRVRLRRLVAVGLGSLIAILMTGIGAARLAPSWRRVTPHRTASNAVHTTAPRPATKPSRTSPPAAATQDSSSATPSETPPPSASEIPPSVPEDDTATDDSAHRLASQSRALLQAGRAREGVALARATIARDPELAEGYVLLAAGLEDLGDWREARRTFATCAERTKSAECRYFARPGR